MLWNNKHFSAGYPRPHLDVHPLDDTGDDVEDLHFGVTLSHLLQQLEEQPEYRLQVLNKERRIRVLGRRKRQQGICFCSSLKNMFLH